MELVQALGVELVVEVGIVEEVGLAEISLVGLRQTAQLAHLLVQVNEPAVLAIERHGNHRGLENLAVAAAHLGNLALLPHLVGDVVHGAEDAAHVVPLVFLGDDVAAHVLPLATKFLLERHPAQLQLVGGLVA